MGVLLATVWILYLAEGIGRWCPGSWVFRGTRRGSLGTVEGADLELLGGRIGLVVLPVFPWQRAYRANGGQWDVGQARARLEEVERAVTPLNVAASGLFLSLLGGGTLLILSERFLPALLPWGIISGLCWAATLVLFFRAYRLVHGGWPSLETTLSSALSPLTLMRAPQTVQWKAMDSSHPLAVAALVCDEEAWVAGARRWYFDHPDDRHAVSGLLTQRGITRGPNDAPEALGEGLARYCPRCHQGYGRGAAICADCDGLELADW